MNLALSILILFDILYLFYLKRKKEPKALFTLVRFQFKTHNFCYAVTLLYFTLRFSHLADAFIQSDLQIIKK